METTRAMVNRASDTRQVKKHRQERGKLETRNQNDESSPKPEFGAFIFRGSGFNRNSIFELRHFGAAS
jgi:hypothetical protein